MAARTGFCIICLFCLLFAQQLHADMIIDPIGDLSWDRAAMPMGPTPLYFTISSNSDAPSANQINAFSVGVRIVPTAGATGLLEIKSVSVPDVNPLFSTYAIDPPLVKQAGIQTISGENGPFANVTVPASGRNLFMAQFHSPGNQALGKFEIYVDRNTTNYFTTTEFDGLKFQNVPELGDPKGVLLGSFTVSVAAVPEPSSTLLLALGVIALTRRYLRRSAWICTPA